MDNAEFAEFEPHNNQFEPVNNPFEPENNPFEQVNNPFEPDNNQFEPDNNPFEPDNNQFEPHNNPVEPTNQPIMKDLLYLFDSKVPTLKELCRNCVRLSIGGIKFIERVHQLPLPPSIQKFVILQNLYLLGQKKITHSRSL